MQAKLERCVVKKKRDEVRAARREQRKVLETARCANPLDQPEAQPAIHHAGYFATMEATYPLGTGDLLRKIRTHAQEIALLTAAIDPPSLELDPLADMASPGSVAHIDGLFKAGSFPSEAGLNKARRAALGGILREHARRMADKASSPLWLEPTMHPGRQVYRIIHALHCQIKAIEQQARKFDAFIKDVRKRAKTPPVEFEYGVLPAESAGGGRRLPVNRAWAWYAMDYLQGVTCPWNDKELASFFEALGLDDLADYHEVADLRKLTPRRRMRARLYCPPDEYYHQTAKG